MWFSRYGKPLSRPPAACPDPLGWLWGATDFGSTLVGCLRSGSTINGCWAGTAAEIAAPAPTKFRASILKSLMAKRDKPAMDDVIDRAPACHVAVAGVAGPVLFPVVHGRRGDEVLLQARAGSRVARHLEDAASAGELIGMSFAIIDGVAPGASIATHAVNYRSAVAYGRGRVLAEDEKPPALQRIADRLLERQAPDCVPPSDEELQELMIVAVSIESGSAKQRTGPADD